MPPRFRQQKEYSVSFLQQLQLGIKIAYGEKYFYSALFRFLFHLCNMFHLCNIPYFSRYFFRLRTKVAASMPRLFAASRTLPVFP